MDTIRLTGVRANGTHGVLGFEHERAQTFIVDATMHADLVAAGLSDSLDDTVDYGRVAKDIVAVIEGEHVDLIERLAQLIAERILEIPAVAAVDVTVHKPHAPITVAFDDVAVSITRLADGVGDGTVCGAVCGTGDGPATTEAAVSGAIAGAGTAAHAAGVTALKTGAAASTGARAGTGAAASTGTGAGTGAASASFEASGPEVHRAVIALGGNMGEVESTMRSAVRAMDALPGTQVTGISPLYRTAAWGMEDGTPDFLNAVVEIDTTMGSHELLAELQRIETDHGRTRENHWDSRPLDLDIIDYDGITSADPELALPHPRAWQRAFVLAPWAALNPHATLAGAHHGAVTALLAAAPDRDAVELNSEDWMLGSARGKAFDNDGHTVDLVSRRAVIAMDSASPEAEHVFRQSIIALDGVPGVEVQGISPLYHVSRFDGPDAMSAVVQVESKLPAADVVAMLGSIEISHEGAVNLELIDMDGVTSNEPECRVPWPGARNHASVLAPWMDMDPNATLAGDPVSFLLAMAPDAAQVGVLSDSWILSSSDPES